MHEEEQKPPPSGLMAQRWLEQMKQSLSSADFEDLQAMRDPLLKLNRQNAPEHAQTIYLNKLHGDTTIGDYINATQNSETIKVTQEVRLYMVTVMMEVHRLKNYREDTLYLACSLADRFLATLMRNH